MNKHPYRALLIWFVIVVALVNIYPTIGWMTLDSDQEWLAKREQALAIEDRAERQKALEALPKPAKGTREWREEIWREQDAQWAGKKLGYFEKLWHNIRRWSEFDRSRVITLGLDLQGGVHMIIGFDINDLPKEKLDILRNEYKMSDADIRKQIQDTVVQQVSRRIHDFEAREPIIQALGDDKVQVQLPGEKNVRRAQALITKTAVLNFQIVAGADETVDVFTKMKAKYGEAFTNLLIPPELRGDDWHVSAENYNHMATFLAKAEADGIIPEDKVVRFSQPPKPWEKQTDYRLYVLEKKPLASGSGIKSAIAMPDQQRAPSWMINFQMQNEAANDFKKATGENVGRRMAIVVDDVVLSAPVINEAIGYSGQITGNFEAADATDLAIALNSGSMVVPIKEEYSGVVGATLGADSVHSGVTSALIGIALVGIFMLVYYHIAGIIALIGLALNAIFVVAAMAYFDMTLTLPGIAGLILTIGMAVDANVLIFERIREELRLGHSLASSVDSGFSRATITILDANVTTLIAAAVLMQFGTGPIEGFAITLSVGVCTSVFSALVVTRAIFDFLLAKGWLKKLTMLSVVPAESKVRFLSARWVAVTVSLVVITVGMVVFGMRGKDMYGVDFTEGTNVTLHIDTEDNIEVGHVRSALVEAGFKGPQVQEASRGGFSENRFLIRVSGEGNAPEKVTDDTASGKGGKNGVKTVAARIEDALLPLAGDGKIVPDQVETVGPAVGKQLRTDAIACIIWSFVFISIYIVFRFDWRFAAGAFLALAHDVLITVGILALLGRHISMNVVAAVLTIIGYSLNDTIVVFDRIREDVANYRGKGLKYIEILDFAINQTLSRTLLTSLTTLFVVLVLFLFGGDAINDFALCLMIGVIVGTYSSIFVASSAVYWMRRETRTETAKKGNKAEAGNEAKKKTVKKGRGGSKSKYKGSRA